MLMGRRRGLKLLLVWIRAICAVELAQEGIEYQGGSMSRVAFASLYLGGVMLDIEKKKKKKAVRFLNETKKLIAAVQTMSTSVKSQFTFLVSMKSHPTPNRKTYSYLDLILETILVSS
jgi:hypothetical protein